MDAMGRALPDPETLPQGTDPVIAWAVIIKSQTEDGLVSVKPEYVNARIPVDLRTTKFSILYNTSVKKYHGREIIFKANVEGEWLPTEILDIDI